jgi:hypothetical protein
MIERPGRSDPFSGAIGKMPACGWVLASYYLFSAALVSALLFEGLACSSKKS